LTRYFYFGKQLKENVLMYREPMLQELSDDQLEMVAGGGGNLTFVDHAVRVIIINSQFVNSPVDSFNGNSNVVISYTGGNRPLVGAYNNNRNH
jgi:hypothetical protein